MAESNTTRLGLHRWSADTDTVDRTEFDNTMAALEANVPMYVEGTRAARPAAGKGGRFYKVKGDTTGIFNGMLFYDDGTSWVIVGANVEDASFRSSAANTIPLIIRGSGGQSASLQEWRDASDVVKASISPGGNLTIAGALNAGGAAFTGALQVSGATTLAALSVTTLQTSGDLTPSRLRSTATRADGAYRTEINADGTGRFDGLIGPGMFGWTFASSAPAGWLLANGQAVSRTTYADLYNAIGTTFGAGDGSTTFNVPDFRGRFPVGVDGTAEFTSVGTTGGARTVNLAHAHYVDHTHAGPSHAHGIYLSSGYQGSGSRTASNSNATDYQQGTTGSMNGRTNTDGSLGVTGILPPYMALTPLIKV